jgi:hypothetical protein
VVVAASRLWACVDIKDVDSDRKAYGWPKLVVVRTLDEEVVRIEVTNGSRWELDHAGEIRLFIFPARDSDDLFDLFFACCIKTE